MEGGQQIERLVDDPSIVALHKLAATDFIRLKRFRAVFDEGMGPYVIVGAYEGRAERIHQGEVSVSTIAGSKQIPNQRLELAVPQFAIQEPNECLFFARSDIIEIINRFRLLELGIVLFMVPHRRIVEDHYLHGVAVAPKMPVVNFHGLRHITEAICWDGKDRCLSSHRR